MEGNQMKKVLVLAITAAALWGCSAPQQRSHAQIQPAAETERFEPIEFKYDTTRSAAWNFQSQLDLPVFQCGLKASTGNSLRRSGIRTAIPAYANSLNDCFIFARKQGDAAVTTFKASNPPSKLYDLGKDLYAKWGAYLNTMSVYEAPSNDAKLAYNSARQAFLTEEKFAK